MERQGRVLCFGNLQLDVLCRPVTALPEAGTLRMIEEIGFALSGNGGNVAAVLGRLGVAVELAGYSGADTVGAGFREELARLGVGTTRLLRHPSAGTGTSVITIAPGGERSVLFVNGANAHVALEQVPDAWLEGSSVVVVGSVYVLPRFTGEAIAGLFARARARGAATVLNTCWDGQGWGPGYVAAALRQTDYLVVNEAEGRQLCGGGTAEEVLARLEEATGGRVVVTRGAQGCLVSGEGGPRAVAAAAVEAVDTTGAGDAFVGGFVAGLVSGRTLEGCAQLGCAVAAYAVGGAGAYPRIPPLVELERGLAGRG